jgi:hypothetical protein
MAKKYQETLMMLEKEKMKNKGEVDVEPVVEEIKEDKKSRRQIEE